MQFKRLPYNFERVNLDPGTDKDNKQYVRKLQATNGYGELVNIVAGLQKDVKRLNQCLTLEGAQQYARKRKNWQAHEADITGPNGKPDGINEVFVTDSKGNIKVINGYTLAKTTYPQRKLYRTIFNTPALRKENHYGDYLHNLNEIHEGFDENGYPYYERDLSEFGSQFTNMRPAIKPKDLLKKFIFDPVYNACKEKLKVLNVPPMLLAQIANKGLATAFNGLIKEPSLLAVLQVNNLSNVSKKEINKALKSGNYLNETQRRISDILNSNEVLHEVQNRIFENLKGTINEVAGISDFTLDAELQLGDVPSRSMMNQTRFDRTLAAPTEVSLSHDV